MTTLRTRQRWVASDTDDCLVRRAIVERLAPHGHWVEVPPEIDPKEADRRDRDAQYLAERWEDRPEVGYAAWTSGGPTWIEPYVDGERWTMIPAIKTQRLGKIVCAECGGTDTNPKIRGCSGVIHDQ